MIYEFGSKTLSCKVDTFGAELISVKHEGVERLWQNESGAWSGHAPILFPFGGTCAVVVDGVQYPCPRHGFARQKEFSVFEKTENEITLLLRSDAQTKEWYPYDFSLFITYTVSGNRLSVTHKAVNEGTKTMYAGFCCHESFCLDGEVNEYEVVFKEEERFLSPYTLDGDGRMTGEARDFGSGKTLNFDWDFMQDNSVILPNTKTHTVSLRKCGTDKILVTVSYPDFPHLVLWSAKKSRMLCIEPWQNLPDDLYGGPYELSTKEGLTAIGAGETLVSKHDIEYF